MWERQRPKTFQTIEEICEILEIEVSMSCSRFWQDPSKLLRFRSSCCWKACVACFWNHDGCFLALDILGFFKTISSCSESTSETVDSSSAMTSVGFGSSGGQSSSTSGFWPTPRRPKRSQRSMASVMFEKLKSSSCDVFFTGPVATRFFALTT